MSDDKDHPIFLGPAPRYFIGLALFHPVTLISLAFTVACFLPKFTEDLPPQILSLIELAWEQKLPALGPCLIILVGVYAYLKMITTEYRLEGGCLVMKSIGLSGTRNDSMTLSLVVDCQDQAGWLEVVMGLSTIHVRSSDNGEPPMFLHGVPEADSVRKKILDRSCIGSARILGAV
jgi:hypothetical protein